MNANDLRMERSRLRDRLRRAAVEQIGQDQVLDMEHLLEVMTGHDETHRGRLITFAYVAAGLKADGATDAAIAAALPSWAVDVPALLARKRFADPGIAAAIERQVVEQLPARLIVPEHEAPENRELARTNPEALLR